MNNMRITRPSQSRVNFNQSNNNIAQSEVKSNEDTLAVDQPSVLFMDNHNQNVDVQQPITNSDMLSTPVSANGWLSTARLDLLPRVVIDSLNVKELEVVQTLDIESIIKSGVTTGQIRDIIACSHLLNILSPQTIVDLAGDMFESLRSATYENRNDAIDCQITATDVRRLLDQNIPLQVILNTPPSVINLLNTEIDMTGVLKRVIMESHDGENDCIQASILCDMPPKFLRVLHEKGELISLFSLNRDDSEFLCRELKEHHVVFTNMLRLDFPLLAILDIAHNFNELDYASLPASLAIDDGIKECGSFTELFNSCDNKADKLYSRIFDRR